MPAFVNRSTALVLTLCVSVLPGIACGSDDPESPPPPAVTGMFVVGPEGGEWNGGETGGLAGVRLVVPPGALETLTAIDINGAVDDTPLPEKGRHVGPLIAIEPASAVLKKPVALTLPFNRLELAEFEVPDAKDCKVWIRDGDKWSRQELLSFNETTVTIELPRLTTAGVGVFAKSLPLLACGASCERAPVPVAAALTDPPCVSPSGYCVVGVTPPSAALALQGGIAVSNRGRMHYVTAVRSGKDSRLAMATYDLKTQETIVSLPINQAPNNSIVQAEGSFAFDDETSASLSVQGYGNVRFSPTVAATITAADQATLLNANVQGVAIQSNGQTASFFRPLIAKPPAAAFEAIFGSGQKKELFRVEGSPFPSLQARRRPSRSAKSDLVVFSERAGAAVFDAETTPKFAPDQIPAGATLKTFAVADFTSDLAFFYSGTKDAKLVWMRPEDKGEGRKVISLPTAPTSMAFGVDGKLYAINRQRAEVQIVSFDGRVVSLPLTTAVEDTDAYIRATPFRVVNVSGSNEVAMLRNGATENTFDLAILRRGTKAVPATVAHLDINDTLAANQLKTFSLSLLAGTKIVIRTTAPVDVDLYVKLGAAPTIDSYDERGYTSSGNETVVYTASETGMVFIGVHAYQSEATFNLKTSAE